MTNQSKIQKALNDLTEGTDFSYIISRYDDKLDKFSPSQIQRIADNLVHGDSFDLRFRLDGKTLVLETVFIGNEIDFYIMELSEYKALYHS